MNFKEEYTTRDILDVAILVDKDTKEKDKVILSNDAYALGKLLECLVNKLTVK